MRLSFQFLLVRPFSLVSCFEQLTNFAMAIAGMVVGLIIRLSPGHLIREMLVSVTLVQSGGVS